MVQSLIVDGLIAGVGGVLVFLPQIVILFVFIALLEDFGYMSRAAFLVDRLMRPIGLSGRAFIPLLSGFACAVPAIMGTRAIGDRRERLITILIIPFMSCSARLPIYMLLIGAFVPPKSWLGGWVRLDALLLLVMYSVGVVFAVPLALLLRKTVFAGPGAGFLLELPSYKVPRLPTLWQRVYFAGRSFVVCAGTVILLVNLVVWALGYFPHSAATFRAVEQQRIARAWDQDTFETQLAGAYLRDSVLGRLGRSLEPAIKPLGWDWRIGVGVIASFPAREVILATLGTVSNLGRQPGAGSTSLSAAVKGMTWEGTNRPVFTLPVALSLMFFFALCPVQQHTRHDRPRNRFLVLASRVAVRDDGAGVRGCLGRVSRNTGPWVVTGVATPRGAQPAGLLATCLIRLQCSVKCETRRQRRTGRPARGKGTCDEKTPAGLRPGPDDPPRRRCAARDDPVSLSPRPDRRTAGRNPLPARGGHGTDQDR